MKIIAVHEHPHLFESAVQFFWEQWGNEQNFRFYQDCMIHSGKTEDGIPRFYVAIENEEIFGTYALIRNDLNSRQDLHPWLACLYVDPGSRGKKIGARLLDHAIEEAAKLGFKKLHLQTDLQGYYEKYSWTHSGEVYGASGDSIKLYEKDTGASSSRNDKN